MVFNRQKTRAGENQESTPINQPETNIREVRTPNQTVFTHEQNELSFQQVVHYYRKK